MGDFKLNFILLKVSKVSNLTLCIVLKPKLFNELRKEEVQGF